MRRTKANIKFWNDKIISLFKANPDSERVENRWRAVRYLLIDVHPELKAIEKDKLINILQNADYIARKMRYYTENKQKETKKILEQEYLINLNK